MKLFNHPTTNGWYTNPQESIKASGDIVDFKVRKGALKGTYIATFTSTKAVVDADITF